MVSEVSTNNMACSLSLIVAGGEDLHSPARGRGVEALLYLGLHPLCQALEAAPSPGQHHAVEQLRLLLPLARQDGFHNRRLFRFVCGARVLEVSFGA